MGGPTIPATPRPIDSKPNAFVNFPRPKRSQSTIDESDMNAAERNKVIFSIVQIYLM